MIDLVVEDGSLVDNANSYVSIQDAQTYALSRGIEAFFDDETTAQNLLRAMDYLYSLTYKGAHTYEDQILSWPRQKVYISGDSYIDDEIIPSNIKTAQIEIAIAIAQGIIVFPNSGKVVEGVGAAIKKEKVGPIETEYAVPTLPTIEELKLPYVKSLLLPYLENTYRLTVQRV